MYLNFMGIITYHLIEYKAKKRILIRFALNKEWNERIKKVKDAKWSNTHKGWHLPDTKENRKKCGITDDQKLSVIKTNARKLPNACGIMPITATRI